MNLKKLLIVVIITVVLLSGALAGFIAAINRDLPQIRSLETYTPAAITEIYSSDNILLSEFFAERREPIPINEIPIYLKKGIIAVEDRKFYSHSGVDIKGMLRALARDLFAGKFIQGASTITQQLAKTLFLTSEKTITRKVKEALLSFQLERRYTKNEILEMYLNQIYLGDGAYGVESAAKIFFNKSAKALNLTECALIAAMPRSPSKYSPLVDPKLALKRRNIVLKQMKTTGVISEQEYNLAIKEPLNVKHKKAETKAPYFTAYLRTILEEAVGPSRLYKGGLKVITTLNYKCQKAAELAVKNRLKPIELRMQQKKINQSPQVALIAISVQTGRILAMIGGKNFNTSPFNRAVNALRQPGSAFKPIVYAFAVLKGFTQSSTLLDAPVSFEKGYQGEDWTPENFSKDYKGEITLRMALSLSRNIPTVRLIEKLGPDSVAKFAGKLGITTKLKPYLSLGLGTSETRLIELTGVYSIFANKGIKIKPYGVEAILDQNRVIWKQIPEKSPAIPREEAAIIVDMLKAVIKEGTGKRARNLKFPVAGKTGTTNGCRDALFIGFSPKIAAGVWVGTDNFKSLGKKETGASAALPIWIDFMSRIPKTMVGQYFDMPDNMIRVRIDPSSGRAVDDSEGVSALFKKGIEPKNIIY